MTALTQDAQFQRLVRLTVYDIEEATQKPRQWWSHNCHGISLAIVKSGLFEPGTCRVVRGTMRDVFPSQHSWVILSHNGQPLDAYGKDGSILDCSVWSYDDAYPYVFMTSQANSKYRPKGEGLIDVSQVQTGSAEPMWLTHCLSSEAQKFLDDLGPLDARGWCSLANQPVGGWPSKEIITAMHADNRLRAFIPIDTIGNLTDLNPEGLYF